MARPPKTPFVATKVHDNGTTEYEVQIDKETGPGGTEETRFRHPAFGIVNISRWHGGTKNRLFQSNMDIGTGISIHVRLAELKRDLSHDWVFAQDELLELYLSPAQFADLITNMNTQGVPCTMRFYRDAQGKFIQPVFPEDFDNELGRIEAEFEKSIKELETMDPEDNQVFKDIAARLPKKDQERLFGALGRMTSKIKSHIPFIRSQFEESVTRTVTHAKHEVSAFTAQVLQNAGMAHLAADAPTLKDIKVLDTIGTSELSE